MTDGDGHDDERTEPGREPTGLVCKPPYSVPRADHPRQQDAAKDEFLDHGRHETRLQQQRNLLPTFAPIEVGERMLLRRQTELGEHPVYESMDHQTNGVRMAQARMARVIARAKAAPIGTGSSTEIVSLLNTAASRRNGFQRG